MARGRTRLFSVVRNGALRESRLYSVLGVLLFSAFPSLAAQKNNSIFTGPRDYLVGAYPESVVAVDFNGDGRPDIATANQASNNVSILLQNSDGTFQPAVNYPVGNGPIWLQVGDFNNDGRLDLILVNGTDNTLAVLLGNGDGTFQTQKLIILAGVPAKCATVGTCLAIGDFNKDGTLDAAVATQLPQVGSYATAVLLGNGDGSFQTAITYPLGEEPLALGAADFNNDDCLDLVTIGTAVSVLPGNGDGTFQAAVNTPLNDSVNSLVIADFNVDGNLDIATGSMLLLGNGKGTFQAEIISVDGSPISGLVATAGDLNGDGKPDLILGGGGVEVLLNKGDGSFAAGQFVGFVSQTAKAILYDLNGDGKLDLVVAQSGTHSPGIFLPDIVTVLNSNADGSFVSFPSYPAPFELPNNSHPTLGSLVAADFNGDGKSDLGVGIGDYQGFDTLEGLYLNYSSGFSGPTTIPLNVVSGNPRPYIAAGDFNGDGRIDVVIAGTAVPYSNVGVAILLGNGDGTFLPEHDYGTGMLGPIAVGDFNNDGKLDVIGATGSQLSVLLGNGNGTFGSPVNTPTGLPNPSFDLAASSLAIADFNRDGNLDVALVFRSSSGGGFVNLFLGNGDGSFSVSTTFNSTIAGYTNPTAIAAGDLNGDGIPDLVVGTSEGAGELSSAIVALLGVGDGTFKSSITTVACNGISDMRISDFNLDGKTDVVASSGDVGPLLGDVGLLLGNGDGTFQAPMQFFIGQGGVGPLAVADFDGDGKPDVAVTGYYHISVLLSRGVVGPAAMLSPAALNFASIVTGSNTALQDAFLTNTGSGALAISSITISGPQSTDYQQTNTCGTVVYPGSTCRVSVTFTPRTPGVSMAALKVVDNALNSPQMTSLNGTGQDFSLITAASSQTVSPGETATYNLTLSPLGGFNQMVKMSCIGISSCDVSPSSLIMSSSASQPVTVSVITTGPSAGLTQPGLGPPSGNTYSFFVECFASLGTVGLLCVVAWRRERRAYCLYCLAVVCIFGLVMTVSSCGGGSSGRGGGGTQPGTYDLTVTGEFTSGSTTLTHNVHLTLVVR